ncbi:MAG: hypothetical protein N2482_01105 [Patescibacteria group bacterium]|nr:hypothetical protein [Patescibacteria group bacterium]
MWQPQFAVYLGKESKEIFVGFLTEKNFFLVLRTEGIDSEKGRKILKNIKEDWLKESFDNLAGFENFLVSEIKKYNLPAALSLAACFLSDQVLYLKTIGEGETYLRRGKKFQKIIKGEKVASGFLEKDDFFVLTIKSFVDLFGEEELKSLFDKKPPSQIVDELTPQMKTKNDEGTIALFIQFSQQEFFNEMLVNNEKREDLIKEEITLPSFFSEKKNFFSFLVKQFKDLSYLSKRKKTLTLLMVIIIFFILLWSVVFGYQRRKEAKINETIKITQEIIEQKLSQAEETAFLNLSQSLVLISEAKSELAKVKKEIGEKRKEKIAELEKMIREKENLVLRKEEKNYEEFFDLKIDNKNAKGNSFYLNEDRLIIVDNERGVIFNLSLTKKSLDKVSFKEIKKTKRVAAYEDIFFLTDEGIYQIKGEKLEKVIEKDKDWGEINDFWVYNGNLYLLDSKNDQIYKYLTAEKGFGEKTSYFKAGEAMDLEQANSMAIDSSVYIGFKDFLAKYTAGVREEFKTTFPQKEVNITKIYTNKNLEKVYVWDKTQAIVFILGKNGSYERQIKSVVFSKADDLVVFDNKVFVLIKEKIYQVELD